MKNFALTIMLLVLWPLWISSQQIWPQIRSIDGYTVCVISIDQVGRLNNTYDRKHEYRELSDSLHALVDSCDVLHVKKDNLISSQKKQMFYQDEIISKQATIIVNDSILYVRNSRTISRLKVQRVALTAIALISILLFVVK